MGASEIIQDEKNEHGYVKQCPYSNIQFIEKQTEEKITVNFTSRK